MKTCAIAFMCFAMSSPAYTADYETGKFQFVDVELACVRFLERPARLSPSTFDITIHRSCDFSWPVNQFLGPDPKFMSSSESYRIDCATKKYRYMSSRYFRKQFWIDEVNSHKNTDEIFLPFDSQNKVVFERTCQIGW